ncbi:MAG: T9SS type A sorting domain-containing protein, partial [Proteobacteria bacterium]|nr:T9SS type A sorting domain-containing protein [Pseudomonadota bacterium]
GKDEDRIRVETAGRILSVQSRSIIKNITIMSIDGRIVAKENPHADSYKRIFRRKGIYFYNIETEHSIYRGKISVID